MKEESGFHGSRTHDGLDPNLSRSVRSFTARVAILDLSEST